MTLNQARDEEHRPAGVPWWLTAIAVLETLSLAVLVLNRSTIDARPLAAALGPIHGVLYLSIVIAVALRRPGARTVATACIPVLGGLLAIGRLRRALPATPLEGAGERFRTDPSGGPQASALPSSERPGRRASRPDESGYP